MATREQDLPGAGTRRGWRRPSRRRVLILFTQILMLAAFLAAWEWLPQVQSLRGKAPVFDPFFVSSPSKVWQRLSDAATGAHDSFQIWSYLAFTLKATAIGGAIGIAVGAAVGLLLSDSKTLSTVFNPFITAMNAIPRIALIPIVIILFGSSGTTSVATSILVVFFVIFYNAWTGGSSVPPEMLENAQLLRASRLRIMLRVRLPYVVAWTFAALPNAITFSLLSVVTAEVLSGSGGVGRLLIVSLGTVDATLTFMVAVVLSIVGTTLVLLADALRKRVLHWWPGAQGR